MFTTRIELRNAGDLDYETLRQEMEKRGFRRTITYAKVDYWMPAFEYNCMAERPEQVLTVAVKAATAVGFPPRQADDADSKKTSGILVTQSAARRMAGLSEAKPSAAPPAAEAKAAPAPAAAKVAKPSRPAKKKKR